MALFGRRKREVQQAEAACFLILQNATLLAYGAGSLHDDVGESIAAAAEALAAHEDWAFDAATRTLLYNGAPLFGVSQFASLYELVGGFAAVRLKECIHGFSLADEQEISLRAGNAYEYYLLEKQPVVHRKMSRTR